MKELFFEYWKEKGYLIDYVLVDYFMLIVYENIPTAKKMIDGLEYNNSLIEELQNKFNEPYDETIYNQLLDSDTYLFKLSWRMDFKEKTDDGRSKRLKIRGI
jgi:hypothetical protein